MDLNNIIVYSYEFIENLSNSFNAILDPDTISKLLEIKRNNKFVSRKTPLRLKYQISESIANTWRKERTNNENMNPTEKFSFQLTSNLNKISNKNYTVILDELWKIYNENSSIENVDTLFINNIFEKAMMEKTFSNLYAQLINDIIHRDLSKKSYLTGLIKDECHKFYEDNVDVMVCELNVEIPYNKLCDIYLNKSQFIGGFIFISHLFIHEILEYNDVKKYFGELVKYTKLSPIEYIDKYMDTLITIMMYSGEKLLSKVDREVFDEDFMSNIYQLKDNKILVKPKYKFKLLDIIELYENKWVKV